jgi:hypothetical protein
MANADVITILEEIAGLLEVGHAQAFALLIRNALSGSPQSLENFLRSNELWGGAGSIADQPFGGRSTQRKELEKLLIQLGRLQLRDGNANVRTRQWVEAFEKWHTLSM